MLVAPQHYNLTGTDRTFPKFCILRNSGHYILINVTRNIMDIPLVKIIEMIRILKFQLLLNDTVILN